MRRETSPAAADIFLFGRLGKRVRVPYAKDDGVLEDVAGCILSSMVLNLSYLLPTLPEGLPLDDLIRRLLAMSYEGDFRIERETKVEELFRAEKAYYRRFYGFLTEEGGGWGLPIRREGDLCRMNLPAAECARRVRQTAAFLRRSRRRAIYRWPKALFTFGNYVDYLLTKVERSKGIHIELTPWERRLPLILGWRHFFRLLRQGHLK